MPEVTGKMPEVTGKMPEVTGKMPEVTGKMPVPHAEEKERASFYLFMSQLCNALNPFQFLKTLK